MGWIHMETVARRKANGSPDWKICKAEWLSDAAVIEGGVPRLLKSGPRKGEPTWKGCPMDKVVVTGKEIDRQEAEYERATGNCHACEGAARRISRVSVADGVATKEYKPCRECNGTGKAKVAR